MPTHWRYTMKKIDTPIYALEADAALLHVKSSPEGLSSQEATLRLERDGPNRLSEPPKESALKRFVYQFHNVLIYVLLGAALLTAVLEHWIDTGVIIGVVLVNAIIGFVQEGKAEKALEGLRQMLASKATVLRDGAWSEIDAALLVEGDVVRLRSGDRVSADMRLLEVTGLRIEEAALTGESVPVFKETKPVREEAGVGDRSCMAHSSTLVVAGRGVGVITATGPRSEIGRIGTMMLEVETLQTPLTLQMEAFGKILSLAIIGIAVCFGLLGWWLHGYGLEEIFLAAIGFAVATIPEGLPAIMTITLALGVERMARRNAITRKLTAVETLGSVSVICSDKTGTLTCNEMTVRHVVTPKGMYGVSGTGYAPVGEVQFEGEAVVLEDHPVLGHFARAMALCNDADIVQKEEKWELVGEPTEGALRAFGMKLGVTPKAKRLGVIPFESENKFMATLVEGEKREIFLKGAPDRLLERAAFQWGASGLEPLDKAFWEGQIEALSFQGLRVLAACAKEAAADQEILGMEDVQEGMVFLGLAGIVDPPRPEAIEAIKACHSAGIRVVMITGDHGGTAMAIAREMGITSERVITGEEIEKADEVSLREKVLTCNVFARTSPEHKLRLVKAFQAGGAVVAMTGDGVNDAPALKRADVGIAMGIKGTEATKEAAKIVLADDNFSSIAAAVKEGRTIYDNLKKAIVFILPTNGAEGLVILTAVLFGLALPLTPLQILWVNMVTAVTLALALSFEPSEPDIMRRPPRKSGERILDGVLVWRIGFVSVLIGGATMGVFFYEIHEGVGLEVARTIAVNTLVFGEIFYLFNARFLRTSSLRKEKLFSNPVAWVCVGILLVLQLVFVYMPFMQFLFASSALAWKHWFISLGIGMVIFGIVEAEKALMRRLYM
ncbi:cation-transporting P-type ATPase [Sulfurospirillum sp. T05]|uniref:Cation-transporting P-type ATPase n=1 Tax=Sulfurospirillum tamanense TaxID=2813362 RepID=A0ABS2WS22_9BACT|nr:cation-transporting P-type ATPase [Sulfurospirillum tamanensis]MBN2963999.1 cation-transporting P-type ATPase [Sulfurospirillum tamanensis]